MKVLAQTKIMTQPVYAVAVVFTFTGIVFFSTKSIFIKKAYAHGVDPVSLMFLRMLIAAPVYMAIQVLNRASMQPMSKYDLALTLLTGVVGYYIASILDLHGLVYISASLERMILYLFPSFVLIISVLFFKHKLSMVEIAAFVFSYLGILVLYIQDFAIGGPLITLGSAFVLASAVAFAVFVVASGRLIARVGAVQFTSVSMLGASTAIAIHYGVDSHSGIYQFQAEVYYYAVLLALICTVLPSYLINMGIKSIGAPKAALLSTCSPLITVVLAYVFLSEAFGEYHVYGFILVIVGMSMITLKRNVDK